MQKCKSETFIYFVELLLKLWIIDALDNLIWCDQFIHASHLENLDDYELFQKEKDENNYE